MLQSDLLLLLLDVLTYNSIYWHNVCAQYPNQKILELVQLLPKCFIFPIQHKQPYLYFKLVVKTFQRNEQLHVFMNDKRTGTR